MFVNKKVAFVVLVGAFVTGCSSTQIVENRPELDAPKFVDESDATGEVAAAPKPPKRRKNIEVPAFDTYNDSVEMWVKYFTGRGRKHMQKYLERSGRYSKTMRNILREEGVPEDLIYIALIESGFSHSATSHASAVGYWQFIRGTGKRYGLEISGSIDERRDPILATHAAAKYFKALNAVFNDWFLAMASYNAGENRVKRAVMKHYANDFWLLKKKRALPRETRNYVPKFLAARLIAENPSYYGFNNIDYEPALSWDEVVVDHHVNLRKFARRLGLSYKSVQKYNPRYRFEDRES
jgi:membrane-bound lytic murein transglycosylase D